MGSILSKIYEEEQDALFEKQKEHLSEIAEEISEITPGTSEYFDFMWLWKSKDKIVKQKQLIDLIQ